MRNHQMLQTCSALFAVLASSGCNNEAPKQVKIESASASYRRPPLHVIEAAGGLAARQEAQAFLDRAREALVAGSPSSASTALNEAAGFFREQTELAKAGAQAGLEHAAADLALLALRLEGGDTVLTAELDLTFARAQIAEAMNHCLLAKDAMQRSEPGRAGDELTMAIDHYERAARDGRLTPDESERASLTDARSAAASLLRGSRASRKTPRAIDALGGAVMRMTARLERRSS